MKTITVAQLRQNPGPALAEVGRGEEYVVLRYRSEIARLVPPVRPRRPVTAEAATRIFETTPIDAGWSVEVAGDRVNDLGGDPWASH